MENQISFQKFSKIVKFGMKVINPYDGAGEGAKLTRLYRFFIAGHLSMVIVIVAFCMLEDPDLPAATEAIAVALCYGRSTFHLLMMARRHSKWQASLGKIIEERKSVNQLDKKSFDLTVEYCNVEARLSIIAFVVYMGFVAIGLVFGPLLHLNDQRLPLNFYIPGLHFEGLGWKWCLNYAFQVVVGCSFAAFLIIFVPLPMLLMNQVCLIIDEAALLVEKLSKSLVDFSSDKPQSDELIATTSGATKNVFIVDLKAKAEATTSGALKKAILIDQKATTSGAIRKVVAADKKSMRNAEIKELTQKIAEMINSVNEWRGESQDLMRLCFLVEFSIISFCFALCLFTFTENVAGSISMLLCLFVLLCQMFLYCWLGTRLNIRVEKLAASLYDIEWHEMNVQQQKDIQLMLTMTQNIGGFDGVFKQVNFETFKEILKFSYSLFGFLKAIK